MSCATKRCLFILKRFRFGQLEPQSRKTRSYQNFEWWDIKAERHHRSKKICKGIQKPQPCKKIPLPSLYMMRSEGTFSRNKTNLACVVFSPWCLVTRNFGMAASPASPPEIAIHFASHGSSVECELVQNKLLLFCRLNMIHRHVDLIHPLTMHAERSLSYLEPILV